MVATAGAPNNWRRAGMLHVPGGHVRAAFAGHLILHNRVKRFPFFAASAGAEAHPAGLDATSPSARLSQKALCGNPPIALFRLCPLSSACGPLKEPFPCRIHPPMRPDGCECRNPGEPLSYSPNCAKRNRKTLHGALRPCRSLRVAPIASPRSPASADHEPVGAPRPASRASPSCARPATARASIGEALSDSGRSSRMPSLAAWARKTLSTS
jgi:hypothetical protein